MAIIPPRIDGIIIFKRSLVLLPATVVAGAGETVVAGGAVVLTVAPVVPPGGVVTPTTVPEVTPVCGVVELSMVLIIVG